MGMIWLKRGIESVRKRYESRDYFPKINWKLFLGLFVFGYIVHSFRVTQMINASDDIFVLLKGYGSGIINGRWALEYLGNFINWKWQVGSFNLSVFDGVLTLLLLSLSICVILELFDLQRDRLGILFGAVFMVYPTCSATFLYMFTTPYYSLGIFLAVLAVYYLKTRNLFYGLCAIICMAVSMGFYQAYFPITVTLCLLLVIDYFLEQDADFKTGLFRAVYFFVMLCLGLGLYFAILYNRLEHFEKGLNVYQGLDSIGKLELSEVPGLILRCYSLFFRFAVEIYHSINTLEVTRKSILFLFIFCLAAAAMALYKQKKLLNQVMLVVLICMFPVAVNLIEIMCSKGTIYELMIYSTVFVFFLPILLLKKICAGDGIRRWIGKISRLALGAVLVLTIICYSWHANWNYVALDYMNRETASSYTTLVTRIKLAEGYKDEYPVLLVGANTLTDKHFINPYAAYPEFYFECNPQSLVNSYAWRQALTAYTGFQFTEPSKEEQDIIYGTEEYRNMSSYPDDGSIRIINDVIVVKIINEQ